MTQPDNERVTCPGCGRSYRWQPALVGKTVPCKQCAEPFIVPSAPGVGTSLTPEPVGEDGTYELDMDSVNDEPAPPPPPRPVQASEGKCPSCNSPVREGAVLCLNCGFNMAEGRKIDTQRVDDAPPHSDAEQDQPYDQAYDPMASPDKIAKRHARDAAIAAETMRRYKWEEYILPSILLGVGLVLMLINAVGLAPMHNNMLGGSNTTTWAILGYLIVYVITLVFMVPILLGAMAVMVAVLGSAFGNFITAVYKLIAMTALVVAIDNMLGMVLDLITGGFGCMGIFMRLALVFALFYPAAKKMFDMEAYEVLILTFVYVIGPFLIGLLAIIVLSYF